MIIPASPVTAKERHLQNVIAGDHSDPLLSHCRSRVRVTAQPTRSGPHTDRTSPAGSIIVPHPEHVGDVPGCIGLTEPGEIGGKAHHVTATGKHKAKSDHLPVLRLIENEPSR